MSTDKCPHCGAEKFENDLRFSCGTGTQGRDVVCYARELAETRKKLDAAEREVTCAGYAAQILRSHVGLDNTKEDLCEVAGLFDALTARVRELEKWKSAAKALWRAIMTEDADGLIEDALHVVNALLESEKNTLGEAMPRKEVK